MIFVIFFFQVPLWLSHRDIELRYLNILMITELKIEIGKHVFFFL